MSLVKTLGKIAIGIAMAKGVGKMVNGGGAAGTSGGAGGLGGLLGSVLGGQQGGQSGGLGGMLGSVLGGGQQGGQSGGGLGGILGSVLGGGQQGGQSSGGLGDMLGSVLGGGAGGGMAGGLGGLLESISGGASGASASATNVPAPAGGSLGNLLNSALQGETIPEPEPAQEDLARILIQAMVNAAKSDGNIDQAEQQKIVANLGDEVSDDERQFVLSEMKAPLDLEGFIKTIPRGAEMQVYMMSLLAIDLDSREEAQYLDTLRKGVSMSEEQANAIHEKLGVPTLYS
ncbi:DUF533 domain-containing protein [Granulosicoccus antarcticus]|uniref:Inner membrane protein YebE n=1 Tax=Granulosicoccus antarcticus IMCC3135 TaxID=1192854 RepID=A0A2Z2NLG4_9GAMM|nr:DUF533 domain-containing protein [Granulosicoccus antarcticus]ASJ71375.1 Inner membrane protein YebE [Granulosicoccus antarcticus IMCC3135]